MRNETDQGGLHLPDPAFSAQGGPASQLCGADGAGRGEAVQGVAGCQPDPLPD